MPTKQLLTSVLVLWIVSLLAGPAMAQPAGKLNKRLKGTYLSNFNLACATSTNGFGSAPPFFVANGVGDIKHIAVHGVTTYDGAGMAITKERGILLNPGPFPGPAAVTAGDETCNWMYTVNPDGTFTVTGKCTADDNSIEILNIAYVGQIGKNGKVLSLTHDGSTIQTVNFGPGGPFFENRICAGQGTELRRGGKGDKDD